MWRLQCRRRTAAGAPPRACDFSGRVRARDRVGSAQVRSLCSRTSTGRGRVYPCHFLHRRLPANGLSSRPAAWQSPVLLQDVQASWWQYLDHLLLLLLLLDRHMILPHLPPQFWTLRPSLDAAISADLGGPVVNAGRRHPSVSFPPIATRREPSEWRIGFPWGSLGR